MNFCDPGKHFGGIGLETVRFMWWEEPNSGKNILDFEREPEAQYFGNLHRLQFSWSLENLWVIANYMQVHELPGERTGLQEISFPKELCVEERGMNTQTFLRMTECNI